jgi:hypothetical protein
MKDAEGEWSGSNYHMVKRNCCHFVEALATELGCPEGAVPPWLNALAERGTSLLGTLGY